MIRVNLLKNRVADGTQMTTTAMAGSGGGGFSTSGENRETMVKAVVIFIFTFGLYMYEKSNISTLNATLARLQAQNSELDAQAAAKAKEVEGIKDIEAQARELEDKLKVLKQLSKLRLREVKTLDFIQSSIPEKVWLKTLVFESDKDNIEKGKFVFTGNAVATEDLTEFVKRLEESTYLEQVIVMKNVEISAGSNTKNMMRDYLFTAQVEGKP